jgi:hypothetical protein
VEALLKASGRAMAAAEIARSFRRGGRRIESKVDQALVTLALYGHVTILPDGRVEAAQVRRAA